MLLCALHQIHVYVLTVWFQYYDTYFTLWDRFEVEGEMTLQEFLDYFQVNFFLILFSFILVPIIVKAGVYFIYPKKVFFFFFSKHFVSCQWIVLDSVTLILPWHFNREIMMTVYLCRKSTSWRSPCCHKACPCCIHSSCLPPNDRSDWDYRMLLNVLNYSGLGIVKKFQDRMLTRHKYDKNNECRNIQVLIASVRGNNWLIIIFQAMVQ